MTSRHGGLARPGLVLLLVLAIGGPPRARAADLAPAQSTSTQSAPKGPVARPAARPPAVPPARKSAGAPPASRDSFEHRATSPRVVPPRADEEPIEDVSAEVGTKPRRPPSVWSRAAWKDPDLFPRLERGVNVYTALPTRRRSLLITVDHRARQPFTTETWRDFFGFDAGGLKIALGLRFGILDDLDVGIFRVNGTNEIFDTYELDARWRFLRQAKHTLDVALRAGATWFYQPDRKDAAGFFGQAMATRLLWDRLLLSLLLAFHTDSSGPDKSNIDTAWSFAVGGLVEVRLARFLAWNLEVMAPVAGFRSKWPAWSSAVRFLTHRHTFSLVLSNTQYLSADGIVAGSPNGFHDLIVGFAITREIGF